VKKIIRLLLLATPFFFVVSIARADFVKDEVLIRYRKAVSTATMQEHARSFPSLKGIKKNLITKKRKMLLVKTKAGESVQNLVQRLKKDPLVESAQPNFIYKTSTVPNDTYYSSLWGVKNTGQAVKGYETFGPDLYLSEGNPGSAGADISLEKAWSVITDCSSTTVAVVDTGVAWDHEDLASNMWDGSAGGFNNHGYDTVDNDDDPSDGHGHGTHVAGTIGAIGNNSKGTVGVCWKASIMAVRVLDNDGSGTTASVVDGINWAVDHGAKVINLSLGGGSNDPLIEQAIDYAHTHDDVVSMAAGNENNNNDTSGRYPCNYKHPTNICVAALAQDYKRASFSNYGATNVDIGAPGVNIVSSWPTTRTDFDDNLQGWTSSSNNSTNWGQQIISSLDVLSVPANWNGVAQYALNTNAKTYSSIDMTGYKNVWMQYSILMNVGAGDSVKVFWDAGAFNPTGGTAKYSLTDSTGSYSYMYINDLTESCANTMCSTGFQLLADASANSTGVVLYHFKMVGFGSGTDGYNVISGTSMATPHVSGLAAMIWSMNPDYTAADVVEAIKGGGRASSALSGKSTTGKVINALGGISYIQKPQGVSAQAVP
jgi:thermitase